MEAAIIVARCQKMKQMYAMRTRKMSDGDWWREWAFPMDERRAHNEGYDITEIHGNLNATEKYPGCPYCGTTGIVQCNQCKRMSCWNGEKRLVCPWCGNNMDNIAVTTEKLNVCGGDM